MLPFLELQSLYDKFDHTKAITDAANQAPRSTPLAVMLCPTDSFNRQPFMGEQGDDTHGFGDNWARGNYGANASLGFPNAGWWYGYAGGPQFPGWKDPYLRGVMGCNCAITMAQMRDGASNTVLLGELRAGIMPYDSRGVWALAGACSSAMWAHGAVYGFGDDWGPNQPWGASDNLMSCANFRTLSAALTGRLHRHAMLRFPRHRHKQRTDGPQHARRRCQHVLC